MSEPIMPASETYEQLHLRLCQSTDEMLTLATNSLALLVELACKDEKLLRSVRFVDGETIPVALRGIRNRLEWLEKFYQRKHGE